MAALDGAARTWTAPLDPRLLSFVLKKYEGDTLRVADCDVPVYHGKGKASFCSGFVFQGDFSNGRMHGRGQIHWPDGALYEGEFVHNQICGEGRYVWPNGSSYVGQVLNGKRHGRGVFIVGTATDAPIENKPTGGDLKAICEQEDEEMAEDKEHTVNERPQQHLLPQQHSDLLAPMEPPMPSDAQSNARYDGMWSDGLPHGYGTLVYDLAQNVRYEGEFLHGQRHGKGRMRYANGSFYEGQWHHDQKHGNGVMIWTLSNEKYEGQWSFDAPNGVGSHFWCNESIGPQNYGPITGGGCGSAVAAACAGNGMLTCKKGNWYHGEFKNGLRHGFGVFYYSNGARYEGNWQENLKDGQGIWFAEDGRVSWGLFEQDRLQVDMSASHPTNSPVVTGNSGNESTLNNPATITKLFVDELIPNAKERKHLENAILRLHSELKVLFKIMLTLNADTTNANATTATATTTMTAISSSVFLADFTQLVRFCRESRMELRASCLQEILRIVRQAQRKTCRSELSIPLQMIDKECQNRILHREFVEFLVRLAWLKKIANGDTTGSFSMANAFMELYDKHLAAIITTSSSSLVASTTNSSTPTEASSAAITGNSAPSATNVPPKVQETSDKLFQKYQSLLVELFTKCWHFSLISNSYVEQLLAVDAVDGSVGSVDASCDVDQDCITVRSVVWLLQHHQVVQPPEFSVRTALKALEGAFFLNSEEEMDATLMDLPLVYLDFLLALEAIAVARAQSSQMSSSTEAYPSAGSTVNSALCLVHFLQRFFLPAVD